MKAIKHFVVAADIEAGAPTKILVQTREIGAESFRNMGVPKEYLSAEAIEVFLNQGLQLFVQDVRVTKDGAALRAYAPSGTLFNQLPPATVVVNEGD